MLVIDLLFQSDPYSLKSLFKEIEDLFDRDSKKFGLCSDEYSWFKERGLVTRMGGENGCRDDGNCELCLYDWLLSEAKFDYER